MSHLNDTKFTMELLSMLGKPHNKSAKNFFSFSKIHVNTNFLLFSHFAHFQIPISIQLKSKGYLKGPKSNPVPIE